MKQISTGRNLQESNGTSQSTRLAKMLLPDYVKIDERSTKDLLAATTRYARLLNLYNLKNEVVGDWYNLLNNDISVLLAVIADTDWQKIEKRRAELLRAIEKNFAASEKVYYLKEFFELIMEIARTIDFWYTKVSLLNTTPSGIPVGIEAELQSAIKFRLSKQLKMLQSYDLGAEEGLGESINLSYEGFAKAWGMKTHTPKANNIYAEGKTKSAKIDIAVKKIRLVYRAFFSTLRYVIQTVPKHFHASLETKADHRPDIALFIAFLRLFKHTQDHLNTLTSRHLNLYYYDILKQNELDCTPDKIHICLELAQHVHTFELDKGTPFVAGKNNLGDDRVYTTDNHITLTQAKIASLKTIFISKNLALEVSRYRLVTGVYAAPHADSRDGLGMEFKSEDAHWPTFGSEQSIKSAAERQMIDAKIGFAVASPILFLAEGERNVTMTITFEQESLSTFNRLILDISQKEKIGKEDAFNKAFTQAFDISLSGEEGWIPVKSYQISPPKDKRYGNEFTITFTLLPSVPPITSATPLTLGEKFVSKWPIAKFTLNEKSAVYSYSFLRDLEIETIYIDVDVKKLRDLDVYNNIGQVDPSAPFQVFGAVPALGSYLLIGTTEIFKKELRNLEFSMEWQGLPLGHGGFRKHYATYGTEVDNNSFRVQLSALSNNEFHPTEKKKRQVFSLFETTPKKSSNAIAPETTFTNVRLGKLDITPNPFLKPAASFDNKTRSGFFKLELIAPDTAFGHDLYPNVFTKTVTENSKPADKGLLGSGEEKEELPLPDQPYTPMVKSLSINYSASTEIHLSPATRGRQSVKHEAQLFHIHPFGIRNTYSKKAVKDTHLLPQYDEDAYLYIGISKLDPPSPLSILFQLQESPYSDQVDVPPEISWSYLAKNRWHSFTKEQLLSDGTEGFMESGIVNLEIPRGISKRNDILPSGLYWLRVAVKGNVRVLSDSVAVKTQVVQATWVTTSDHNHLLDGLAPNTLTGMEDKISAIRSAEQPFPSFGGRPSETQNEFYARISERLRHKNRAITHWEYERLVLNQFPNIAQVKCLTHNNNPEYVPLGSVTLVVAPKSKKAANPLQPKVNFNVLRNIKNYISKFASAFVDISVINPIYERVKISCGVVFTEGDDNGKSLQMLNDDIEDFMCPWIRDDREEISLGGKLNRDAIQHFIEQRPYAKFLTKLSMVQVGQSTEGYFLVDTADSEKNISIIETTTPWSVLIPLEQHQIGFLEGEDYQSPETAGYETMGVGIDFVLGDDGSDFEEDFHELSPNKPTEETKRFSFMQIDLDLD
jgi:hypothetical protein